LAAALLVALAVDVPADPPVAVPSTASQAPAATAAESPIDQGISIRLATLRDLPDRTGSEVGNLPANTPVLLYERSRLWVRIRPSNAPQAPAAWASLLDFRFGAAPATSRAPTPGGGGFAGFSRSVSSLLAGFSGRQNSYSGNTATIGIRGLTSQELGEATPNYQALAEVERFAIAPLDAQNYALAGGLVPQRLSYLAIPAPASTPAAGAPRQNPFQ